MDFVIPAKILDVRTGLKPQNKKFYFSGFNNVVLFDCEVEDLSAFECDGYSFFEFSVWSAQNDRHKWESVKAKKWAYFELK